MSVFFKICFTVENDYVVRYFGQCKFLYYLIQKILLVFTNSRQTIANPFQPPYYCAVYVYCMHSNLQEKKLILNNQ